MAVIRPDDLPASGSVPTGAAIPVDTGAAVEKATPLQIVDSAIPLASQAEAEAGTDNEKRVTPLRVAQAISALGVSNSDVAAGLALGPSSVAADSATAFTVKKADNTTLLAVNTVTPFVSIAGTRTSNAPRLTAGTVADIGYDSFITSNCQARGSTLFRDEFQDTCDFQSLNGAHASFDAFTQYTGSVAMNHARGFQARMKLNMTGGVLMSEWTGHFVQPIFNGTFNISEAQAVWIRDAQVDSGTQNLFAAYGIRIDDCPNWGANFKPIVCFDAGDSYLAGGIEFANTADLYGLREVRGNAVHGTGAINTFVSTGGVAMYDPGAGYGVVRSYSDGSGATQTLVLNPTGGQVIVGNTVPGTSGTAFDVPGLMSANAYYVGANQVVGAQGAAVADATDAATVITQLNALLARLRTHGLIAT